MFPRITLDLPRDTEIVGYRNLLNTAKQNLACRTNICSNDIFLENPEVMEKSAFIFDNAR